MEKRFINIKELGEYIGVSRNTIYSWIWLRKIPYTKIGGKLLRFDLKEIEPWLKKQTIAAKPRNKPCQILTSAIQ